MLTGIKGASTWRADPNLIGCAEKYLGSFLSVVFTVEIIHKS